eukprot:GEMP01022950.1.p1 GENE.GEMP01022950.1~~GEMP01022950.1.p1  ORF type:complete len:528 (+),score=95.72 GEMP01022950.1:181-1764(+)
MAHLYPRVDDSRHVNSTPWTEPRVVYSPPIIHEDLTQVIQADLVRDMHGDSPLDAQPHNRIDDRPSAHRADGGGGIISGLKRLVSMLTWRKADHENERREGDDQPTLLPFEESSHVESSPREMGSPGSRRSLPHEDPSRVFRNECVKRYSFHTADENSPPGNYILGQAPLVGRPLPKELPRYPQGPGPRDASMTPSTPRARPAERDVPETPPRRLFESPSDDDAANFRADSPFANRGGRGKPIGLERIDPVHPTRGSATQTSWHPPGPCEPPYVSASLSHLPSAPTVYAYAPPPWVDDSVPRATPCAPAMASNAPGPSGAYGTGALRTTPQDVGLTLPRMKTVDATLHDDLLWMQSRESIETETFYHLVIGHLKTLENEWNDDPAELEAYRFISKRMKQLMHTAYTKKLHQRNDYFDGKDSLAALQRERKRLEEDKSYLTRSPPSSCETKWKPTPPDLPESDYTPRATVDLKNIIWHQEALLHTLRFLRSKLGEEDVRIKDALGGLHNQLTPADNGTQRLFPRKRVL